MHSVCFHVYKSCIGCISFFSPNKALLLAPGSYFGEEGVLCRAGIEGSPTWLFTVMALTHVELLSLSKDNFIQHMPRAIAQRMGELWRARVDWIYKRCARLHVSS
jgi:CRP-like cAMP-binding protein